ncbi:hypothetical protein [Phaeovulum sp. W22_SRMD_FR3]|uniref:hypothetical protein n=1 Tax=Phaeovulum sp. W22_SRMD_FR3 TaxID=3240274 RepID=UPI003F996A0F
MLSTNPPLSQAPQRGLAKGAAPQPALARYQSAVWLAALLCAASLHPAQAEEPMSAIDWLTPSVVPAAMAPGGAQDGAPGAFGGHGPGTTLPGSGASASHLPPLPGEAPVSNGAGVEDIVTSALGQFDPDRVGLIDAARSGLPAGLWGLTPERALAAQLRQERVETLPALQALLRNLLLAELDPPLTRAPGAEGSLLLARVDRLLDMGALDPAYALLIQAGPKDPERFRRLFDIALLLGEENRACALMRNTPEIAPALPTRIFCLARRGDWSAASLTFGTASSLGQIPEDMQPLLALFLDDEMADGADELSPPQRPTPLAFRLMEAIGQPMPTTNLPVAFAQADLRANTGWKSRIEAAERLARMGSVEANQLLGLYTEQDPAASGGVWDRVAAIRALDKAITAKDPAAVATALPTAWARMAEIGLEANLGAMFGSALEKMPLQGEAAALAFDLGMLSEDYETIARDHTSSSLREAFLMALARGNTAAVEAPDAVATAIKSAFDTPSAAPAPYAAELEDNRLGEALLMAIDDVAEGARGDTRRLAQGLQLLRYVGLESTARRAGLEVMVMQARG